MSTMRSPNWPLETLTAPNFSHATPLPELSLVFVVLFILFYCILLYFIFLLTTTPFRLQDSWHQRWSSMDLSFHQLCTHTKPTVRSFYILLSLITDILFPSFSLFVRHGIIWTALPPNPLLQPQWSTGTHLFDGEEEKSHLSFRSQNLFD